MTPIILLALACAPDTTADETTLDADTLAPRFGAGAGEPAPHFQPHAFTLSGWTALEDGEVVDPSELATVTLTFWTEQGFHTGDTDESCEWVGYAHVLGPAELVDTDDAWTAAEVTLDMISTSCLSFPDDIWGETTPTTALTNARIALGHGPLSDDMHGRMTRLYDRDNLHWGRVADDAFATWLAVDRGEGFEAVEVGAAFAYDPDTAADAPLTALAWDEDLPDGVVYTHGVVPMGTAWIE